MNNTKRKATREFEILNKTVKNAIIFPFKNEILALVRKFGDSGQSGGSASYTAAAISSAVKTLCLQEPICDLTGADDEWNDNAGMFQNNRLSSVFKDEKNGKPYYIDAIIFKGQRGNCFTSSNVKMHDGSVISSTQFIRFPFKPITFYIDVIETEWADEKETVKKEGGGCWSYIIKDEKQLEAVFEHYEGGV